MVKVIYRAKDGKEFDEERQAEQHEAFIANATEMKRKLTTLIQGDNEVEDCDEGTVERFVVRQAVALLALLKEMAVKSDGDDEDDEEDKPTFSHHRRRK